MKPFYIKSGPLYHDKNVEDVKKYDIMLLRM